MTTTLDVVEYILGESSVFKLIPHKKSVLSMIIFGEHQNFLRVLFRKVINPTLVHTRKGIIDGWSRWSEPMVGDHENYFLTIFFSVGGGAAAVQ